MLGGRNRSGRCATSDIAIVGMACVMPGAPDVESFWANVVDGVDSVSEVPPSRWDQARHFDPELDRDEAMSVSKWGGFIPDVGFDALAWGIPPASLASIDPAQLLALKCAAGALDDAGYGEADGQRSFDRDAASVIYATGSGGAADLSAGFLLRVMLRNHGIDGDALPPELDAFLPQLTEDGLPGVLTSVIAGRVANRLDLGGKNLTVDSACASVLVALDIACNELNGGSSDLVLCGGVDLHNGALDYVSFTAAQALSPSGRCRSFDTAADGMTLAEGAGCLVLKRLADAERDGDRVYATVRGVAGSSDGRHLGLTAPRQEGQERAVRRAYDVAGVTPAEVGMVEAHGTGTPTGDRIELGTMTEVFSEGGAAPGSVVLGSVKSNIGHIKCAAGVASLIKAAKSAYHGVFPPTLHLEEPNEVWDPATSPFVFLDRARPWLEDRRVVGVSGFGFGGTNFHAIVENHAVAPAPSGRPHWPAELFALRANSDDELRSRLDELRARLQDELAPPLQTDRLRLRDIAAAESARGEGPIRLAAVVSELKPLEENLITPRPRSQGKVAFVFPGPGAARLGMAADLAVASRAVRAVAASSPPPWIDAMWPPQAFAAERDRQQAALEAVAAPAVAVASLMMARTLAAVGVFPDRVVGCGSPLLAEPAADEALRASLASGAPFAVAESVAGWTAAPDADKRFVREIRALADDGVGIFVEVGPTADLTDVIARELGDGAHIAVAVDQPDQPGVTSFLRALGQLAEAGVELDLAALHRVRDSQPQRWTNPPKRPGWIVNGHYARTASGDSLPKGLHPANDAPQIHIAGGPAGEVSERVGNGTIGNEELAAVVEYLRIVHGVMSTASEIVNSRAGSPGR